jgi:riboflavin kinase / FMN adenylyltransferase
MFVFDHVDSLLASKVSFDSACLGNFDGVHLGHQALFKRARGRVLAFTFEPHPGKVLQPDLAPKLIATQTRKIELLDQAKVDGVLSQPFTTAYAQTSPEQFERVLFDDIGVRQIVVGRDFTYGAKRKGTLALLQQAAVARGAEVDAVDAVTVDGVVVSSSRIRELLLEGRVEAASRLLGRPFDLDGIVVTGAGRGRTIGFPTANVDTVNELKPAAGVYAVRIRINSHWHGGAANIGVKPTFGGNQVTVEVHVLDFAGDLYSKPVRLEFLAQLRAERRFASVAELTAQIARDVEAARAVLARHSTTL